MTRSRPSASPRPRRPLRLYRIPLSTNVERVSLALAHKQLPVEFVDVDPDDRSEVRRVSGQDLVPVLVDGDSVVRDSMEIVRHLERLCPDPPLYPREAARRAEMLVFIDWFNKVWKRPPNDIEAELGSDAPDREKIARLGRWMTESLDLFEDLLVGRDYLMGDFSAADVAAFPFLKYAILRDRDDPYLFHEILIEHLVLGDGHRRLRSWIARVDARPRAHSVAE